MNGYPGRVIVVATVAGLALAAPVPAALGYGPGSPAAAPAPLAAASAATAPAPAYRWPLDGTPTVVRRFDPPPQPWLAGHRGVDLAAAPGDTVVAAGAGVVLFAGVIAGRGVLSVEHRGGLRTTYEPVFALVRAGDRVAAGEPIGRLEAGHASCAEAACLHWGLRRGERYLDPLVLLGLGRVRLLPLARVGHGWPGGGGADPSTVSGPGVGLPVGGA